MTAMTLEDRAKGLARALALQAMARLLNGRLPAGLEIEPAREDVELIKTVLAATVVDAGLSVRPVDDEALKLAQQLYEERWPR